MTIATDAVISSGQLWATGNRRLYIVERIDGPDRCFPIVMREVERSAQFRRDIESHISSYARSETAASNSERRTRLRAYGTMEQDRQWFDVLGDVRQWHGTPAEWRAAVDQ